MKTWPRGLFTDLYFYHVIPFSIFCQNANIAGSNCVATGWNLSNKQKLALNKKLWNNRHSNFSYSIGLAVCTHVLCSFMTMTSRSFSLSGIHHENKKIHRYKNFISDKKNVTWNYDYEAKYVLHDIWYIITNVNV